MSETLRHRARRSPFVSDEGAATDPPILLLHAGIADFADLGRDGAAARRRRLSRHPPRRARLRAHARPRTSSSRIAPTSLAVLDALGIERAALVGNSLGGVVAFDTAIEFPERVVAVVGVGGRA